MLGYNITFTPPRKRLSFKALIESWVIKKLEEKKEK